MGTRKTSIVFTGDIGFDHYMDRKWEDENLLAPEILDFFHSADHVVANVKDGDIIDFVCDYYSYDGEYLDSYMLGEQLVVEDELVISDVYINGDAVNLTYLFTDLYNREYWTDPVR